MKNPFRDDGIIARSIPWVSIALVIFLTVEAFASGSALIVKVLATLVAVAVVARSVQQIGQQIKKPQ